MRFANMTSQYNQSAAKRIKVLVIQQKMIGDVLASTVICEAIKTDFPNCEIHYMVQPNTKAVVENNPFVDKLISYDQTNHKGFKMLSALGRELKKEKYDAVIDAYGKWESVIPAYLSRAKIRIGNYKWYTSFFYTKTVMPARKVKGSAIHHRLQLAEALTGKFAKIDFPKIYLTDKEIENARAAISSRLDFHVPIFMISVLGSGKNKSLPPAQMAETLDLIAKTGKIQILFNFMPSQEAEAKIIFDFCEPETQKKIMFDFYTKSLRDFLAVLSQCNALIGNEGGAVNMAKALNVPTFTVFSPWINKDSWSMLTDDDTHVAVHLQDYFPEIYGELHPKKFKKQSDVLYKKLAPELFGSQLQKFVNKIIS
jgi:heptosyltransferase-2